MGTIGRFVGDLLIAFVVGVLFFFLMLVMLAGMPAMTALGIASMIFAVIAFLGRRWVVPYPAHCLTVLVYLGYAAGTFA